MSTEMDISFAQILERNLRCLSTVLQIVSQEKEEVNSFSFGLEFVEKLFDRKREKIAHPFALEVLRR